MGFAGIGTWAVRPLAARLRYCTGLQGVMSVTTYVEEKSTCGVKGVAGRLRQLRGTTSQEAFARRTGIKQAAYSNYERGLREIPLSTASRIADALSIDLVWLLIGVQLDCASARDPRLAEMLAWLANEWEAHNDHGRESLRRRFEAAFPEWDPAPQER